MDATREPGDGAPEPGRPAPGRRLSATILALGLASFFNDVGSEMCFPLLPAFVVMLGAGPTFLGLLEGVADAVASFLKIVAGYWGDRLERSKPLVATGYALPCGVRPLLAFATAPLHVLGIRLVDRVGKGLRTAPRDAWIAAEVPRAEAGRAYGFQRAMDHSGGVVGPLCATALLAAGCEVRTVFLAAVVPSVLAMLAVAAVREKPRAVAVRDGRARAALPRGFRSYLAIVVLFSLANSSEAFLLLRAGELGVADATVPLLWAALHVARAGSTLVGGHLADRVPRAKLLAAGWTLFAASYLGLAHASEPWQVWVVFVAFGVHTGIVEPAERAIIRDLAPDGTRGRAFGWFHGVIGGCAIPAGIGMGWLWEEFDAGIALMVAASLALLAAVAILGWGRRQAVR